MACWIIICAILSIVAARSTPTATDCYGVKYEGLHRNDIEIFLGIQFGQDTSGANRFKPPRPYAPKPGTTIKATQPGPACPQETGAQLLPLYLGNITSISEDCLRLNVARPTGTKSDARLPVMVWIHGGSFVAASKDDPVSQPDALIRESVENGHPVIHVSINYRLGIFGFAQSSFLKQEGSENAGLRDQRLALEWVAEHIAEFGGDPDSITVHGQSSGGLAVGMQILAYGGSKPAPFDKAICQSQALEAGITGNYTTKAMGRVISNVTHCSTADQESSAAIECLRSLSMLELLGAQIGTYIANLSANIGDEWLPVVDGDFLPAAPSDLIATGRFNNITTMIGWCEDDTDIFLNPEPSTAVEVHDAFAAFLPSFTEHNLEKLLSLYPVTGFTTRRFPNGTVQHDAEFYRAARILRDIVMVCQPILFGEALAKAGNDVYYYTQNQTVLQPVLHNEGIYGVGVVHTSEFAYMFGNLTHYNSEDFRINVTASDYELRDRQSRSWSSFATFSHPSVSGKRTLEGWETAAFDDEDFGIYVIGGPNEGYSGRNGRQTARSALKIEMLQKRCSFLNAPEVVKQQGY